MKTLSTKALGIAPSSTLSIDALAKKMAAEGRDILKFAAGEPDFQPPENIRKAAIEAVNKNLFGYSPVAGLPELRDAIAAKLSRENSLDYSREQIIVSNGAKHVLLNIMLALLNLGDEVIIPAPAWITYREQVQLAGGIVKWAKTDENYKLHADEVESAITPKTKAVLINSPCNPTGAVFDDSELDGIADLAVKNDLYIISDECYEHFVYGGKKFRSTASFSPEAYERTIIVNAASKTYAITGWRIGYAAGPKNVIKAMTGLQSHSTSNPCNLAQYAVIEALNGPQDFVRGMVNEFDRRRKYVVKHLNEIEGFDCPLPEGAFYAFPRVSALYRGRIKNSVDFCNYLLNEAGVALVPGDGFEADGCVRFSYASSMEAVKEGIERIKKAVEKI